VAQGNGGVMVVANDGVGWMGVCTAKKPMVNTRIRNMNTMYAHTSLVRENAEMVKSLNLPCNLPCQ